LNIMGLFRRFGLTCYLCFEFELGSGGCESYWEEKFVDYVGRLQGLWPITAKKLKGEVDIIEGQ